MGKTIGILTENAIYHQLEWDEAKPLQGPLVGNPYYYRRLRGLTPRIFLADKTLAKWMQL